MADLPGRDPPNHRGGEQDQRHGVQPLPDAAPPRDQVRVRDDDDNNDSDNDNDDDRYGGWRVWVDTLAIVHSKVSFEEFRLQVRNSEPSTGNEISIN